MTILIRNASENDISQIALLHKKQFSTHFLGRYSTNLIEKFYACFLCGELIFLVSEYEGAISGFVLGGKSKYLSRSKEMFLKENRNSCIIETILNPSVYLLAASRILPLFSSLFQYRNKDEKQMAAIRLLSIAVNDKVKGQGVANLLIEAFENKIKPSPNYGLSVNKSNKRAIKFYCRNDFAVERETESSLYFIKNIV